MTTQLLKNLIGSYIRNGWLPATLNSEINHAPTDQYVLFLLRDQLQSVLEIVQTLRQYLSEDSNEERYSPKARIGTIAVHLATIERLVQGSIVLTDDRYNKIHDAVLGIHSNLDAILKDNDIVNALRERIRKKKFRSTGFFHHVKRLEFKGYKAFQDASLSNVAAINLLIGRNNSGKSSILDVLERVINHSEELAFNNASYTFTELVTAEDIAFTLLKQTASTFLKVCKSLRDLEGKELTYFRLDGFLGDVHRHKHQASSEEQNEAAELLFRIMTDTEYAPTSKSKFARLSPDRDVVPEEPLVEPIRSTKLGKMGESAQPEAWIIKPNGGGSTALIEALLNQHDLDSQLIEVELREKLNEILGQDAQIDRIVAQKRRKQEKDLWEIYLEEKSKGWVPLSRTGHGIKTVLLVLLQTIVIPKLQDKPLSEYVFGFEELENNLHPGLLRRLLKYLFDLAKKERCTICLTTHSPITIDYFATEEEARIFHVTHQDGISTLMPVENTISHFAILKDLDARPSDLLQANCIFWVEGPSDRIYLRRWIELMSNNELQEGRHYQIVTYGGALLKHMSAEFQPNQGHIELLKINPNIIVHLDRDSQESEKHKIWRKEAEKAGGMVFITKGYSIENYIPQDVVRDFLEKSGAAEEEIADYFEFWPKEDEPLVPTPKRIKEQDIKFPKKLQTVLTNKVELAKELVVYFREEHLKTLDLDHQLSEICCKIRQWNDLPPKDC